MMVSILPVLIVIIEPRRTGESVDAVLPRSGLPVLMAPRWARLTCMWSAPIELLVRYQ
jgi:hypothetical protein